MADQAPLFQHTGKMNLTMAIHGDAKSGKTWLAATFPRPVFISAAPERGWTALPAHPNWPNITVLPCPLIPGQEQITGDPSAPPPPDWALVKDDKRRLPIADMEYIVLRRIREEYQQRNWRTVVIDTTTIYDEMVVSQLSDYGKIEMGGKGGGQWNVVKQHMLNMVNALQTLPLNIVWVFHSKYIKTGDIVLKVEPAAVGSHWEKVFAPTVRIIAYLKKEETLDQATGEMQTTRALLLKCPPNINPPVVAGGNFEHLFQGKDWCLKPHWDSLAQRLQGTFNVD
jgi:hypothetical protein